MTGQATQDGEIIFSNDLKFEKTGKLEAFLSCDVRSYNLTVDNVFRPIDVKLIFKIEDRVYNIDMRSEPLKFISLEFFGNEKVFIQNVIFEKFKKCSFLYIFVLFNF